MADSLFTNPDRNTRSAKPPKWVIAELVDKWGCNPASVRHWPTGKAFAVLYSYRERKEDPKEARAKRVKEMCAKIEAARGDDMTTAQEYADILIEGFANLDSLQMAELARAVAIMLKPPVPEPAHST